MQNNNLNPDTDLNKEVSESTAVPAKAAWKENEAPVGKWILTAVLALVVGVILQFLAGLILGIVSAIPSDVTTALISEGATHISAMISFAFLFLAFVLMLKKVAKTSLKAFILGADNKDKKLSLSSDILPILGLYALGLLITIIPFLRNVTLNSISTSSLIILIVFSILFTWMQTSWEEFIFRGLPLRLFCKNEIGFNKKSWIVAVVTSLLFMLVHISNPEVLNLSGIEKIFAVCQYFLAGFLLFVCDLLGGSLLPGLLIHWLNNFIVFVFIADEVSATGATSIFINHSEASGTLSFFALIITYLPVLIYLYIKYKKKKALSSSDK